MKFLRRLLLFLFGIALLVQLANLIDSVSNETSEEASGKVPVSPDDGATELPGLAAAALKINLEEQGLTCGGPRREGTGASWVC